MTKHLEHFLADVRFGMRMLIKAPGFTTVAVLVLALGIGANSAIFSVFNGILLQPLPYPDADRLAVVYARFSPQGLERGMMSLADFVDWKSTQRSFEEISVFSTNRVDITAPGDPESVKGTFVSADFFSTLQAAPMLGRVMHADEDSGASARLAVLSEDLWKRHFGANPDILGKVIQLQDISAQVIGVMPASFQYPPETEVWVNEPIAPRLRGPFHYYGLGRLKPGVSLATAQVELNTMGRTIEAQNPGRYSHLSFPAVLLRESMVGNVRPLLLIMLGCVLFVLLIAAANVANLLLVKAVSRNREIVLRSALGASRSRIVVQLLTESCLLSIVAGALGLAFAYGGIRLLAAWNPGNLPRMGDVHIEGTILLFTLAVSLLTGVLFGMVPAFYSMKVDLNVALKEQGHSTAGSAGERRTGNVLVAAEIAFAFVLLTGAGLLLRSFSRLQQVKMGAQAIPQNVLTMQVSRSTFRYVPDDPVAIASFNAVLDRVRHIPGVEAAGLSTSLPPNRRGNWDTFQIEGQPWTVEGFPASTAPQVSPDYFRALQIPVIKGRYFTDADNLTAPPVCIISQTLAKRYFDRDDPIGKTMHESSAGTRRYQALRTIVGVVGDVKYTGLNDDTESVYYTPIAQDYSDYRFWLSVRTSQSSASMAHTIRRELEALDHTLVVNQIMTLNEVVSASTIQQQFNTSLLFLFAVIALLLAAIGIYGVTAYSVTQRTAELGVRIALGARRTNILGLIVWQCLQLALVGLIAGVLAALALTRLLSSFLFHVRPTDFVSFATVTLLLLIAALMAGLFPGWRAMRTDPIRALRHE